MSAAGACDTETMQDNGGKKKQNNEMLPPKSTIQGLHPSKTAFVGQLCHIWRDKAALNSKSPSNAADNAAFTSHLVVQCISRMHCGPAFSPEELPPPADEP